VTVEGERLVDPRDRPGGPGPRSAESGSGRPAWRERGWFEVRWRQFRRAPKPIVRAVLAPLVVAVVLGLAYLAYDVALSRGARLPGGDLRILAATGYVVTVLAVGSVATYLLVRLPAGAGGARVRSPWSAALGFFAAAPIAYLVLVVLVQLVKPLLD
jgi:hypothetical protein